MKENVFVVNWKGPHAKIEASKIKDAGILYLATGGTKKDPNEKFRYVGITEASFQFRSRRHSKLALISRNPQIWFGWLDYPNPLKPKRSQLEDAEHLLIYYWGDLLNERKTSTPPSTSITLISRWSSKTDEQQCRKPKLFRELPDVISWDANLKLCKTANFSKRYNW